MTPGRQYVEQASSGKEIAWPYTDAVTTTEILFGASVVSNPVATHQTQRDDQEG